MRQFYFLWSFLWLLPFCLTAQNFTAAELNEIEQAQYQSMMGANFHSQNFGGIEYGNDGINEDFIPTAGATETFNPAVGDHFFDTGGPGGSTYPDYDNPGDYTSCGCVTNTTLAGVSEIKFIDFSIFATFDWLKIYDGTDNTGTLLYNNSTGGINEGDILLADMIASHGSDTFTSTSGNFFFEFNATTVVAYAGWDVEIMEAEGGTDPEYCGPITFEFGVEPITRVVFSNIDNSSSADPSSPAHEDFTSVVGNVAPGDEVEFAVEGYTGGNWTNYFTAFIDWNQNGTLNDAGEVYEIGTITNSTGEDGQQAVFNITIPDDAQIGETMMRVFKVYEVPNGYNLDPCSTTQNYGQVEDYTLNIGGGDDGTSDNCSDVTPTTLTNGVSVTFTGDTSEGTASTEEMNVLGYGAVWEAVTLTGDCNNLTIDYCGTPVGNMSNMFIVYTPDCPATSYVVGSYDFTTCGDGNGTLRFIGLPAGTYYLPVIIDGSFNVLGEYTMNVISEDCPPPPANDDCEDAIAVACGDNLTGSTFGAMDSGGNPSGDVFYSFTGTGTSELVTVSLCGSSYDTYLRVFTDCTLSTEIAFNDDFCGLQSELTFTSDGTSTYIIMVEGYSSNVGDFVMNIDCDVPPPPPAECEDHEVLDNGMENAYFFANRLAVDIPVGDTGFTVEGLYITIAVPEGTEASSFNFIFFDDNSGIPGSEVGSATGSIIGSEVIGQNFGRDFIQYNVDFDAGVSLNANTNYWMEVQSDAEAWDWTSEMTSIIGQTGVLDNGTGWATADGGEFVYALYCEEMGVSDMNDFEFAYYPNPVKDYLNIESQKAIESIDAFNLAGQKVISNAVLSEGKINLNNLSAGTYVFRVKLEGGQVETFKVVKK